jgi:hypothetical protein
MRLRFWIAMLFLLGGTTLGPALAAQTAGAAARDPSARLREVLPPDVAAHVLAVIADARSHGLPAAALEQRALKFAARGVPAQDIARSVAEQAERQARVKTLLESVRGSAATDDEVEAGAEATREGLDGHDVSALARSAPSGRSLTIPLYVLGSLTARGLPSDQALARVSLRLAAGASDADLETLPGQASSARSGVPGAVGREMGAARRPPGVPVNGGARTHPGGPPSGTPVKPGKP